MLYLFFSSDLGTWFTVQLVTTTALGGVIGSAKHRTLTGALLGASFGIFGIIAMIVMKRGHGSTNASARGEWRSDPTGRNEYRMRHNGTWTQSVSNNGITSFDGDLPE